MADRDSKTSVFRTCRSGGSRKGRLWTYLDPLGQQVVFDATETQAREGPEAFLATYRGDLHADAYTGYDALYATGRIHEIAAGRTRAAASSKLRPGARFDDLRRCVLLEVCHPARSRAAR